MNQSLRILVNNRNFWSNVEALANILEPAKNAVKSVECKNTTMADVFFALIQMAISIKALPTETSEELKEFRQKCIQFYNYRWKQFDFELYLLAYFLHPKYRGKGLIPETYQIIQKKALTLWQKIGGSSNSALALAIQMNDYDNYKSPYNFPYIDELQTFSSWWLGCKQSNHYLQELALYILSIVPHSSASCERVFSILNWFTQKRRSRLKVEKVSNMARLHSFYISNAQQELNYAGKNLSEDAFNQIMQDYAKSLTLDSDMFEINNDNDDDDPFENLIPEEEEENNDQLNEDDSNLLVGNLIKLNNVNREDIELEEVDHGDLEFSVDDILANVNRLNSKI
ncbi:unnamed protein product [Rhizophagus irregularis]|nr:unnamed protein product [Rhizophagus irregularis]